MPSAPASVPAEPPPDCGHCPRLAGFRAENQTAFPDFHNAPVPSFGPLSASVLIVGLAPGLKGANATGRPFTGDHAGDLLYPTLLRFGLASGDYGRRADDGLTLTRCRITNAVRCVPPQNKPTGTEAAACRPFLTDELAAMPDLAAVVALGAVAHRAVIAATGLRQADHAFAHAAQHNLAWDGGGFTLADSYHCSRYNTNTGRLTPEMFDAVFQGVVALLG